MLWYVYRAAHRIGRTLLGTPILGAGSCHRYQHLSITDGMLSVVTWQERHVPVLRATVRIDGTNITCLQMTSILALLESCMQRQRIQNATDEHNTRLI